MDQKRLLLSFISDSLFFHSPRNKSYFKKIPAKSYGFLQKTKSNS